MNGAECPNLLVDVPYFGQMMLNFRFGFLEINL